MRPPCTRLRGDQSARSRPARSSGWWANPARARPRWRAPSWGWCRQPGVIERGAGAVRRPRPEPCSDDARPAQRARARTGDGDPEPARRTQSGADGRPPDQQRGAASHGVSRAGRRTAWRWTMLRAVRIPDPERRFDAYPHELSGGMAQRVVIAIALVCSPKLVISDDATSGLDVTVQAQVLELLQAMVRDKGAAALFITRDIAITAHFCTRIAHHLRRRDRRTRRDAQLLRAAAASLQHHAARCLLAQSGVAGALDAATADTAAAICRDRLRFRRALRPAPDALPVRSAAACAAVAAGHEVRCHFPVEPRRMTAMLDVQDLVKRFPICRHRQGRAGGQRRQLHDRSRRDARRWSANPVRARPPSAAASWA